VNPFDDIEVNPASFAYNDLLGQDRWLPWTVTRTSWTDVGTPTVTGRFQVKGKICLYQMKVVPRTSVATTAGTSYFKYPIQAKGFGGILQMHNAVTNIDEGAGVIDVANSRGYPPTHMATSDTLTLIGWYEI